MGFSYGSDHSNTWDRRADLLCHDPVCGDGQTFRTAEDPAGGDDLYLSGHDRIFPGIAEYQ